MTRRTTAIDGRRSADWATLWTRLWRHPFGWLLGFGHRRWPAGIVLAVVIATAGLTFDRLDAEGAVVPATPVAGAATESCGPAFPCFNAAVYGADVVLPIIDFGQDSAWRPDSSAPRWTFAVWFRWISIALGWLLASIFVAAFTSLVRRD